jgi:hypothetical protein
MGIDRCNTTCLQQTDVRTTMDAWDKSAGNAIIFIEANWGHIEVGVSHSPSLSPSPSLSLSLPLPLSLSLSLCGVELC